MVIDVQKDVVANAVRTSTVTSNINSLISQARTSDTPVIWVQHSDDFLIKNTPGWDIVDELQPKAEDVRIYKTHPSSFEETDLSEQLKRLGITSLVITGAQTDMCINATSRAGVENGFEVTLVSDAHTTEDNPSAKAESIIEEKNRSFALVGKVLPTSEVFF